MLPSMLRRASRRPLSTKPALEMIKTLRLRTSAPMTKCVDALKASDNDVDKAIDFLRKQGVASAAKLAGRTANDGAIGLVADGNKTMALIDVSSETDFVAKQEIFVDTVSDVAHCALSSAAITQSGKPVDLDIAAFGETKMSQGNTVSDHLLQAAGTLKENIALRRATVLSAPKEGGYVFGYLHNKYSPTVGRSGAMVALATKASNDEALQLLGSRLCMHIVATKPVALTADDVGEDLLAREREILSDQATASGKPPQMVEKIVQGRMRKYFQEVALLEQTWVVEQNAGNVRKVLEEASRNLGTDVIVAGFTRFQIGHS